jgi:hypothetical protein
LNLDECIELARLTILTSGNILNLLTEMDKKITQKEVKDLMLAKITKNNGFEFI